ncbi:transposable element Tc1 transposase [Trichonephila clavipes]|nr:transposable element Tc1 transposase [Trichonephila clavipes]
MGSFHRAWRADWPQVVFCDESCFNLKNHDGRIRVRRYARERCLPEIIIERNSDQTPGVIFWSDISYYRLSQLLGIQGIPEAIIQQDNLRPHISRNVCVRLFSALHMQLLPWPAYLPDMSSSEHRWDLVGRRLSRNLRPTVSK